jgi:chaperone modulatory protein CbpM
MISLTAMRLEITDLDEQELGRWIDAAFVRAEGQAGDWRFQEIDVARIRLIMDLRHDLEVEEQSLPVVLSLMDQLYDLRRRMSQLNEALAELPVEVRSGLMRKMS